ncbi:MAG: isopeptide-forming domain-containing fimbrial protein, partial [Thermodesulfobacteriota bacterium]
MRLKNWGLRKKETCSVPVTEYVSTGNPQLTDLPRKIMLKIWTVLSRAATVVLALLLRVEAALTTEHTINNNQLQSLRFDDGEGSDSMDVRWIHPNQPAANSFVGERRDAYERAPDTSIPPVGQDFDMRLKGIFTRLLVWPAQALGAAVALPLRMGSNRKVWQGRGSLMALPARGSRLGFPLLLFALLLGAAAPALAGTDFCSDYKKSPEDTYAIIDGNDPFVQANLPSSSFGIDINCEFRNFPISAIWPNGLEPTLNFYTPNKTEVYLVVFDNVWYSGNLACSNIDHKLWVVNSDEGSFGGTCQDIMIPAETIAKQAPAATATIGVPFTYTLTLPSMNWPVGDPSANDLHTVILWDDLTAAGADLTYVDINAYYKGSGAPVTLVPEDQPQPTSKGGVWTTKNLSYKPIPLITTGEQIVVEITVVLDDTPTNVTGTVITNTAKWWFGRLIDIDGVPTFFDPLPGEWGVSQPMTIAEPNLVVTKSGSETALNLGIPATFTIDLQNTGGSDAWNATILDQLPDGPTAGMCDYDPTSGAISAQIFAADGVTPVAGPLLQGTAYSVTYDAPTCQLSFSMLTSAAVIGPSQRLIITYQSELDAGTTGEGLAMVNLAGATQWSSADGSHPTRTYTRTLTDGTPAIIDHEDSYTITTALSGYYFQKTVANLTTAANPATGAAPGDRLRYRLRLFNVDQTIDNITIDDTLDPANFDTSTFSIVTLPAGSTYSFDPVTGLLEISGNPPPLNIAVGGELVIEFEIDLAAGLTNGIVVPNQATLTATGLPPAEIPVFSDDPFINSIAPPGTVGDPTNVLIQTPGPLSKTNTQPSAMIGEQFKYRITLPAAPLDVALYDVRILDDLIPSNADMRFINANVVSGGSWTLSNTGTDTSPVIEDTATGIDIPANGQAVIEITVELLNTTANQSGVLFNNSASYTYNRSNGVIATETSGEAGSTNVDMIVVEPDLTVAKVGTLITAAPVSGGSIIEYAITMTNGGNATAYDVNIVDTLPPELALYGTFTPTATIDGIPVVGFVTAPTDAPAGPLLWGQGNGDGNLDIPAGSTLILTYQAQVQISAAATFNNDVSVDWTSLDAASTYERTGAGCPTFTAPDDYCATAISAPISIIDNNSLTKAVVADSWITDGSTALDATVRIGDTATYQLTLNLGEGTTSSVEITDVLDPGLEFVEVVSINGDVTAPYSSVAPFSYTDFPAPTILGDVTTGTTMTWTLGDVYNTPDGDNTNNSFVIEYRVRVAENVLAQAGTTTLTNTATLGYVDGSGNAVVDPVRLESNATLTLLQPDLTVSKSVATAGGDLIIGAGELITYTVDVINNGLAPAYDTVVEDVIPAGLRDGAATITMVSTELLIGGALTNLAPAYDPLTGIAIWNFDTGTANQYTIPAADTLRIVYTVQADPVLGPGLPLTNAAIATLYYSFDDEAIPVNSIVTDHEVYGPSNTAQTTLTTAPGAPLKVNPADTTVTIGQEFTYAITVPEAAQPTALYDVRVLDDLGAIAADLTFVGISKISPAGTWVPTNSGTASNLIIEDTTNGIDIPANEQIVIGVTVRLDKSAINIDGLPFSNSASYTYNQVDGDDVTQLGGGSSVTTDMTVVEPDLIITKVGTPIPAGPITGGSIIEYAVTMVNSGNDTAYDVNIVDTLPPELALYGTFTPTATIDGIPVVGFVTAPTDAPAGPLLWGQGNGDGNLDIPAGSTLILTYQAQVQVSTVATFDNTVWVDWTSLDAASTHERTGAGCPTITAPDDYCATATSAPFSIIDNNSLNKAVIADSYVDAFSTALDATVRIGDTATYQLTLNLGEG